MEKLIALFLLGSSLCVAQGPPTPSGGTSTVYKVIYQNAYVYASETVTNADFSTTWVKYATVTNTVDKYAPILVIDILSKQEMDDEWQKDGRQFIALLGTNSANFYHAELSIK